MILGIGSGCRLPVLWVWVNGRERERVDRVERSAIPAKASFPVFFTRVHEGRSEKSKSSIDVSSRIEVTARREERCLSGWRVEMGVSQKRRRRRGRQCGLRERGEALGDGGLGWAGLDRVGFGGADRSLTGWMDTVPTLSGLAGTKPNTSRIQGSSGVEEQGMGMGMMGKDWAGKCKGKGRARWCKRSDPPSLLQPSGFTAAPLSRPADWICLSRLSPFIQAPACLAMAPRLRVGI